MHFVLYLINNLVQHVLGSQIKISRKDGCIFHRSSALSCNDVKTFNLLDLISKENYSVAVVYIRKIDFNRVAFYTESSPPKFQRGSGV